MGEIINEQTLRDMFPGIHVEIVKQLLGEPYFKAFFALQQLSNKLEAEKDLKEYYDILSKAYTPAQKALTNTLESLGYTVAEISAALMIEQGLIK